MFKLFDSPREKHIIEPRCYVLLPPEAMLENFFTADPFSLGLIKKIIMRDEAFTRRAGYDEYARFQGKGGKSTLVYYPQCKQEIQYFIMQRQWSEAYLLAMSVDRNTILDMVQRDDMRQFLGDVMWVQPIRNLADITNPSRAVANPNFVLPISSQFPDYVQQFASNPVSEYRY